MIESSEILNNIVSFLKEEAIKYVSPADDGRINSALIENQITEKLQKFLSKFSKLKLIIPNKREWYDFAIADNADYFLPVNIKATKLSTDNLNCKLGIFYALTGILPISCNLSNETDWENFCKLLSENINRFTDKDYYFLVCNKNDNTDFFWTSLKHLKRLTPNGNNLPFQADWKENRDCVNRTHEQAGAFILEAFKNSIYKRAQIKDSFNTYVQQHLDYYLENCG